MLSFLEGDLSLTLSVISSKYHIKCESSKDQIKCDVVTVILFYFMNGLFTKVPSSFRCSDEAITEPFCSTIHRSTDNNVNIPIAVFTLVGENAIVSSVIDEL